MSERKWILDRVAKVRESRRREGHELSRLQEGIVEAIAAWEPAHNQTSRKRLADIETMIHANGRWAENEEWRISTFFNSSIVKSVRGEADLYEVEVECDGQKLACGCPTLEGAFAFMRLYQALIVDQFYSVGPPWADTGIFKS